jgi:hypothetical protein
MVYWIRSKPSLRLEIELTAGSRPSGSNLSPAWNSDIFERKIGNSISELLICLFLRAETTKSSTESCKTKARKKSGKNIVVAKLGWAENHKGEDPQTRKVINLRACRWRAMPTALRYFKIKC